MPVQGMDFVLIEGGIFVMGAPVGEVGRDENDEEPHLVELTQEFLYDDHGSHAGSF